MKQPGAEEQLCAPVVAWLRAAGWEVFQEVKCAGSRADIVARRDGMLWIIEAKCSFGLKVLQQAAEWDGYAHLISVLTHLPRGRFDFMQRMMGGEGIGWIVLLGSLGPSELLHAERSNTLRVDALSQCLVEKQKDYAPAGNAHGDAWTPWRETCDRLAETVREKGAMPLRDALRVTRHHYQNLAAASTSMAHWVRHGSVKGATIEMRERRLWLVPKP